MKHIIILGDGMADSPLDELNGLTPLEYAHTPAMDSIAAAGGNGAFLTLCLMGGILVFMTCLKCIGYWGAANIMMPLKKNDHT